MIPSYDTWCKTAFKKHRMGNEKKFPSSLVHPEGSFLDRKWLNLVLVFGKILTLARIL